MGAELDEFVLTADSPVLRAARQGALEALPSSCRA